MRDRDRIPPTRKKPLPLRCAAWAGLAALALSTAGVPSARAAEPRLRRVGAHDKGFTPIFMAVAPDGTAYFNVSQKLEQRVWVFAPTGAWKRSFELPKPSLVVGFANGQLYADKDPIGLLFASTPKQEHS